MKDKYLLPWIEIKKSYGISHYRRYFLFDDENYYRKHFYIAKSEYMNEYCGYVFGKVCWGKMIEIVKTNMDKVLVENGYILVSEEDIEKYKVLL
jgi:hypothetical protein